MSANWWDMGMALMRAAVVAAGWLLAPAHAEVAPSVPAAISSPTQVAYLQVRVKEARQGFAQKASAISGVPTEKILLRLPLDWRAGDPRYAIIPYLERSRHAPLNQEQRRGIEAADLEMKAAIAHARTEALKH